MWWNILYLYASLKSRYLGEQILEHISFKHNSFEVLKLIIYFIWSSLQVCVKIIWNRKVFETYKIMNKSCSSIGLYVFRTRMWVLFMEGEKGAPPPTLNSKYPKWVLVPGLYFNSIRRLILNLLVLNLGELVMRTGKIVC